MFSSNNELTDFIHRQAKDLIGDNGIIGTAMIVFEFIDEEGRAGFSLLRPPGTSWEDSMDVLAKATDVILDSYERGGGIQNDDDTEDFS